MNKNLCESCLYYDFDEYENDYICTIDMDEDEAVKFIERPDKDCPYYRYYDEYLTVRKQN